MFKKFLCVFLALLTAVLLPVSVFAAEAQIVPLIIVSGTNNYPLIDTDTGEQVFPPNGESVKNMIIGAVPAALCALTFGSWNRLADKLLPQASELFEELKCNPDGTSAYNITTRTFEKSMAFYPEKLDGYRTHEDALCREAAARIGAQNVYVYNYDWRLSPIEHAEELAAMVETVLEETGKREVSLAAISLGGAQVMAYLGTYEPDCIHSVCFLSSTFTGAGFPGDLFTKNIEINEEDLYRFLVNNLITEQSQKNMITALFAFLDLSGLSKWLLGSLEKGLTEIKDRLYDELLCEIFRYVPAFWALIDNEHYEQAKQLMLPENSDEFIKLIDDYHYNILCRADEILNDTRERGTYIYVTSNYNRGTYPLYESAGIHTDGLLDTFSTSGGAYCAAPFETLDESFVPDNRVCTDSGHSHRSADGIIDASTCLFPEQTWFIKNLTHVGCARDTNFTSFVITLTQSEQLVSVDSFADFPQFLITVNTYSVTPLTQDNCDDGISDVVFYLREHFWN